MTIPPSIEFHRLALLKVLGGLFVLAGIVPGGDVVTRLPLAVRASILRVLRPAQSAARRLVFALARGMVEQPARARRSAGNRPAREEENSARIPPFPLFDRRKYFAELIPPHQRKPRGRGAGPRILFLDEDFPASEEGGEKPARDPDNARRLCGQMQSLHRALENLDRQARRMKRAMARRAKTPPGPGRAGPLRPGQPPGGRQKPSLLVDTLLAECDRLARADLKSARASP